MVDLSTLNTDTERAGREAAARFRDEHHLGSGPIKDMTDLVQATVNADITLLELPDGIDSLMYSDDVAHAVLVAVGTSGNPERQRFSIAHELGHWALKELAAHADSTPNPAAEHRAHAFARHLLLPTDAVDSHFKDRGNAVVSERDLSDLVSLYEVSGTVAAIQLFNAGLIDARRFADWEYMDAGYLARRYGWAAERDARVVESRTPRPPQRMLANATDAYVEHYLSVETLALINGSVTAEQLQAALDADGIRPRPLNAGPTDYDDFGLDG